MDKISLTVLAEDEKKRVDVYLTEFASGQQLGLSRNLIQQAIASGKVTVNSSVVVKPHHKLRTGDTVVFLPEEKTARVILPENIPLEIVYEDDDLAVINKPVGLVVHPAPGNYEHTLVNALLFHFKELSDINPLRPGIVHRLDKDTSGILVVAKTNHAHLMLSKQFADHSIQRKYIALVKGKMDYYENVIELPIGRHPYKRDQMAGFGPKAKYARTHYRTLEKNERFSLVELEPFTGRTHQLRVHLAYIGHPILGDVKYGRNNEFERLALHAKSLGFIHPRTGKQVAFDSDVPAEFKKMLQK
ncbi:MAG: RluA family pseudouridine synthase [Candidatus Omnitrophota bacterium]|jgi:23S rRNA pseudouridine1911/1915/1917 synthase